MVRLLACLALILRHIEQRLFGEVGSVKFHFRLRGGIHCDNSFNAGWNKMPNIIAEIET
jgi:hypothetical protein